MSKIVCIDSQIFIWGVKRQAIESQRHLIPIAINFIDFLTTENFKILVPNPIITEILSPVPAEKHKAILDLLDKRFIIAPFDNLASLKCAELLNIAATDAELVEYRKANSIPKNKIKFDCMIAAICITKRVHCIYSNDPDIKRYAAGQVSVLPLPNIGRQADLFDDHETKNIKNEHKEDEEDPF